MKKIIRQKNESIDSLIRRYKRGPNQRRDPGGYQKKRSLRKAQRASKEKT